MGNGLLKLYLNSDITFKKFVSALLSVGTCLEEAAAAPVAL